VEYIAEAVHQEGLRFFVTAGVHAVQTDYPLRADEVGSGPRPLELLLASLASCAGGSVIALLRRAGQPIGGLKVSARGQRRAEHPTVFTDITLEFVIGGNTDPVAVAQAVEQSEARICPVWAMLKPSTKITTAIRKES
jgi:putative redox protein